MLVYNLCLDVHDVSGKNLHAKLGKCDGMKRNQSWVWIIKVRLISINHMKLTDVSNV
jgi:hypothetical protein